ncbi:hypothetical protein [Streptomyces sp. NPDC005349]|uniref:hypothetical protein n=1 Tax=unclassified Streptomyces TaxID=2593676 RepID=UPI0033B0087C
MLAPAAPLGIANTTFRRNFPDTCAELADTARNAASSGGDAYNRIKVENARLRREKRDLAHQLELALAAVPCLSTDNDRLRTALHEAQAVTPYADHRAG